jgi:hypothetical protein
MNPAASPWCPRGRGLLRLAVAMLLVTGSVSAEENEKVEPTGLEWQNDLTKSAGTFPAMKPMHAHYRFGWMALDAGEADFDITRQKGDVTRLAVVARSIGLVRSTWKMNAEHVYNMDSATLRPISFVQSEVYRKESEKTRVEFKPEGLERRHEVTPAEGKVKTKRFKFPHTYDLHSALQFIRTQALKPGDVYKIVVYPGTAPYLTEVDVERPVQLKINKKEYAALPMKVKLWKIHNKTLKLEPHADFKSATVWISNDADLLILRIEADIMVGSVWGELEKVEMR